MWFYLCHSIENATPRLVRHLLTILAVCLGALSFWKCYRIDIIPFSKWLHYIFLIFFVYKFIHNVIAKEGICYYQNNTRIPSHYHLHITFSGNILNLIFLLWYAVHNKFHMYQLWFISKRGCFSLWCRPWGVRKVPGSIPGASTIM